MEGFDVVSFDEDGVTLGFTGDPKDKELHYRSFKMGVEDVPWWKRTWRRIFNVGFKPDALIILSDGDKVKLQNKKLREWASERGHSDDCNFRVNRHTRAFSINEISDFELRLPDKCTCGLTELLEGK